MRRKKALAAMRLSMTRSHFVASRILPLWLDVWRGIEVHRVVREFGSSVPATYTPPCIVPCATTTGSSLSIRRRTRPAISGQAPHPRRGAKDHGEYRQAAGANSATARSVPDSEKLIAAFIAVVYSGG